MDNFITEAETCLIDKINNNNDIVKLDNLLLKNIDIHEDLFKWVILNNLNEEFTSYRELIDKVCVGKNIKAIHPIYCSEANANDIFQKKDFLRQYFQNITKDTLPLSVQFLSGFFSDKGYSLQSKTLHNVLLLGVRLVKINDKENYEYLILDTAYNYADFYSLKYTKHDQDVGKIWLKENDLLRSLYDIFQVEIKRN
jgi:hypothetical protein